MLCFLLNFIMWLLSTKIHIFFVILRSFWEFSVGIWLFSFGNYISVVTLIRIITHVNVYTIFCFLQISIIFLSIDLCTFPFSFLMQVYSRSFYRIVYIKLSNKITTAIKFPKYTDNLMAENIKSGFLCAWHLSLSFYPRFIYALILLIFVTSFVLDISDNNYKNVNL